MLNSYIQQPCELTLHLPTDLYWVYPAQKTNVPGHDQALAGVLEIDCPSERTIESVQVTVRIVQTVVFGTGRAARTQERCVFERALRLEQEGRAAPVFSRYRTRRGDEDEERSPGVFLERGVQDFEFVFLLPAWVPPYERSRYGRTRMTITASAQGAGRGGSAVTTSQEAFVVQEPTADGGPEPLEMHFNDVHEALGLISISLTAASVTVGGILHFNLYHPKPTSELNVHMVRVFVEQQFELYSHDTGTWERPPPEKLRVYEVGGLPPRVRGSNTPAFWTQGILVAEGNMPLDGRLGSAALRTWPTLVPLQADLTPAAPPPGSLPDAGRHGYRIRTVVRLPDDRRLRPTTLRGTRSDIRVSHELGTEVFFSRANVLDTRPESELYQQPKIQVFSMKMNVVLPTCACTYDSIHLPPYSRETPPCSATPSRPSSPIVSRRGSIAGDVYTATPAGGGTTPTFTTLTRAPSLNASRPRTPSGGASPVTDAEHHRMVSSLTSALHALRGPSSRAASREPSPTRSAPHSRPSSRPSSPTRSAPPTPGGRRSHDRVPRFSAGLSMLTPSTGGNATASERSPTERLPAPRALRPGTPWAVSNLPRRTGESHDRCNCGQSTGELIEAEERFLEGAPTAPGSWIETPHDGANLPPWTPSSRPMSPTNEWLSSYSHRDEQGRPQSPVRGVDK